MVDAGNVMWIGAGLVAGGAVTTLTTSAVTRFWTRRVDPTLDRISTTRRHRRQIAEQMAEVVEQFRPNAGSSLVDRVERLETGQTELGRQVAETRANSVENRGLLTQIIEILTDPDR